MRQAAEQTPQWVVRTGLLAARIHVKDYGRCIYVVTRDFASVRRERACGRA